jgi:4-amino-4-deoxy-L-arabinose transferase-like glycosyltransferase
VLELGTTVLSEPFELEPRRVRAAGRFSWGNANTRFWLGVGFAVVLGAAVRFAYLFHGAPRLVLSDGFAYHADALSLADGFGYASTWGGDVGVATAQHPPGWVTLLAGVAEIGGRDMRAHQVTGMVIGLGLIVVAALVGRRYAGRRVGVVAAFLAAAYPGFWVLEAQILSEPLGLVVAGLLMLVLADLWERPTLARALLAGAASGALALVRSEQLALLAIAVAPILLLNPRVSIYRRLAWTGAATLTALVLLAPWTIYNLGRFEEPVLVSTNVGYTLHAGNCPATTYSGGLIGSGDIKCNTTFAGRNLTNLDQSQSDIEFRQAAFENMRDNVERLPATILARYGRTLGVFRPAQTVGFAAAWAGSATWPVWAWVTSFWVIAPLAVYGSVLLRRARTFQWPLVAPLLITLLVVTLAYGEPRYHTPADLGIIVLAAVAFNHLMRRLRRPAS